MNFDTISMSQRAKQLIKETKPSPYISGLIITIFWFVGMFLIPNAVSNKDSMIALLAYVLFFALYLLLCSSIAIYCLKITREETVSFSDVFFVFKEKQIKFILLAIVKILLFALCSILFGVGILIPFYLFRFSGYILVDDSDLGVIKAMDKSAKMLKGHYVELLKIDITVVIWWILGFITMGLSWVHAHPYSCMLWAEFYDHIRVQYEEDN